MHAVVDPREADRKREEVEERREARRGSGEYRRAREARHRVARRERVARRDANERLGLRVAQRRPIAIDARSESRANALRQEVDDDNRRKEPPPAREQCEHEREDEPDSAELTDPREPDEDRVEPINSVMNDPALEIPIEVDQRAAYRAPTRARSASSARSVGRGRTACRRTHARRAPLPLARPAPRACR
jgi:hypothetical protein